jgi:hypothetical protein
MPITDAPSSTPLRLTTTIRLEDIDPRALSTIGGALSGPQVAPWILRRFNLRQYVCSSDLREHRTTDCKSRVQIEQCREQHSSNYSPMGIRRNHGCKPRLVLIAFWRMTALRGNGRSHDLRR